MFHVNISGHAINFSTQAENVGFIRSSDGKIPNHIHRFAAHRACLELRHVEVYLLGQH